MKSIHNIAVIFDMDGVLVDNSLFHFKSWETFLKKFNIKLTNQNYQRHFNGRRGSDTIKVLVNNRLSHKQIANFLAQKERIYRKIYKAHIKPVKGLVPLLQALHRHKIKMALATSATEDNVNFVLKMLKIKKYFKYIISSTQVTKGKPHPQVYLKTAKLLKVNPKDCIVFEDALNGIESAQRAKMKVIGIATTNKAKDIQHADLVFKDFSKITIEKLLALIA